MPWKGGRSHCCGLSGRFLPFLICFLIEGWLCLPSSPIIICCRWLRCWRAWRGPWVITWSSGGGRGCPSGRGGGLSGICPDPTTHRTAIPMPGIVDTLRVRGCF